MVLPEAIAKHSLCWAATIVVRTRDQASGGWANSQSAEKVAADPHTVHQLNCAPLSEVEAVLAPGEDVGKNVLSVAYLLPERVSEPNRRCTRPTRILYIQLKQRFGLIDWQHPQHHGIDQTEDRCITANAERDRQDGDRREAGRLAQHTDGEGQIAPARFNQGFPTA